MKKTLRCFIIATMLGTMMVSTAFANTSEQYGETGNEMQETIKSNVIDLLNDEYVYLISEDGAVQPIPYSETTLGGITIANGVTAVWFKDKGLYAEANTNVRWKIYTNVPASYTAYAQSLDGKHKYTLMGSSDVHGEEFAADLKIVSAGYYKYCIKNTSATDITIKKCTLTY